MLMVTERLDQSADVQVMPRGDSYVADDRFWCALLIEPQQEVRVNETLRSYQVRTCMPLVPHWTTRGLRRTKVQVYRPMLRGYILVRDDSFDDLRSIRRPLPIHGFLRFGDCLAIVTEQEMQRLANQEQELAKPRPIQANWEVGEVVRINKGPYHGFQVPIMDLANGERITVEVKLFGRHIPMPMDEDAIEKL